MEDDLKRMVATRDPNDDEKIDEYEDKYLITLAALNQWLNEHQSAGNIEGPSQPPKVSSMTHQSLPRIEIGKFNGQISEHLHLKLWQRCNNRVLL
ncbi:hypothetical protein JYU34_000202 [Plutella xylostella]|uniref:Uncharacterized protein n=1 Tax=Plutella xylostella TaxID=51655 RepID=A0ABQ7R742_PLUXY|nr:hypothetical protein JYU34_000202 [Plutella xylostella]